MSVNFLEGLSDNIVVDTDKCIYCGICVETCILDNLRMKLSPCRNACPLGVNCQGYIQLIARGEEKRALDLVRETLPFPGILGRICSRPCEDACHRKETEGEAVAVRELKRYLSELEGDDDFTPAVEAETGKKVAVVGSGPAGLMAAFELRKRGHAVTVFEEEAAPGGMLRWAIPEFRLPLDILQRDISVLDRMGVTILCGKAVGNDIPMGEVRTSHDAVIITTGCTKSVTMEGLEKIDGLFYGLSFLKAVRSGTPPEVGKTVVVIGGGNVAVDAAQTALRLGAGEVTMVCLEAEGDMPAFPWALEDARTEGVTFQPSWGNVSLTTENDRITGVAFQRCLEVYCADGIFNPAFDSCETLTLAADTVIIAIGQRPDDAALVSAGLDMKKVQDIDPLTLQADSENIFIAGDVVTGPSSAVEAMAQGLEAAESVDRYLKGKHLRFGRSYAGPVVTEFDIDTSRGSDSPRVRTAKRKYTGTGDFSEIEVTLTQDEARREAKRCYCCGEPFGKHRSCWFCLACEVECPEEAIWIDIPYLLR
ncbi:MAG: FAD-dependent oxidoreductase [Deltaproteobacteria bacterium]|nr:FAD-dependent oxidoreductase [Candidatus Zymogenaceae bacterium]